MYYTFLLKKKKVSKFHKLPKGHYHKYLFWRGMLKKKKKKFSHGSKVAVTCYVNKNILAN